MDARIKTKTIQTDRLLVSYLTAGVPEGEPLLLIHGNASANLFWDDTIAALCDQYRLYAPDMRGYGASEALPIDATRGLRDWSDDLHSFIRALDLPTPVHLAGWSLGGGIAMQFAIDHPQEVRSLILIAPMSPYGFGGTKDIAGTPCYSSFSGSGGGAANSELVKRIAAKDMGNESPSSPRNVMNQLYFKPPFQVDPEQEDRYVTAILSTRTGEDFFPGAFEYVNDWPGVAPGTTGITNAISPKYVNLSGIVQMEPKCPILWIRGADDAIVSDQSLADFGTLGKLGYVPGWPGEDEYPPQPMVSQIRDVLEQYQRAGGFYQEIVMENVGHAPHIEKAEEFIALIRKTVRA
ncbi:alpha/beta hydrolase [Brevibacillus formosus]|uniref:alpha/beta fold hydrolase n=1 Tax=Brevibacillus formosus TaxID=54913 RepID=UPI0018CFDE99|nr:alpha/beta hydrolase [Brevibacillus formosus]MBG9943372.1 alpha/beta hydrolase [Brevibacillus formosus]